MKDTQKKRRTLNYHLLRRVESWKCRGVTAFICPNCGGIQTNAWNISKRKNNLSITKNREVKQFYVVPINDDEFSLSQSASTLNVGCMYFVTYIPTDVKGQRLQGSADLKIETTRLSWRMPVLCQKKVSWTADPHVVAPRQYFCMNAGDDLTAPPKKMFFVACRPQKVRGHPAKGWVRTFCRMNKLKNYVFVLAIDMVLESTGGLQSCVSTQDTKEHLPASKVET